MTNEEIMSYIYEDRKAIKEDKDLSRMKMLMEKLGNPQDDLKFIHVTGTNGKGSTTTMMANVLKNSGYKVGKFISPYIVSFNERIQINNEYITDEELTKYIEILKPIVDEMIKEGNAPIGFELITAIAFMYFKDNNCDIVCLEVGMGGRLDPTNVIKTTVISIITLIDFDHTKYLGDTLEKIATEKCGIIKPDKITVTYPLQDAEALNTIRKFCAKNKNKLFIPSIKLLDIIKSNHNINYFSYKGTYYKLNLIGQHQIYNALMVIVASNILIGLGYKIPFSAINNGIFDTTFPARLEKVQDNPLVFLDGSHNVAGAKSLKNFLYEYKGKRNYAIMSFSSGKEPQKFLEEVGTYFQEIAFVKYTQNKYRTPEEPEDLVKIAKELGIEAKAFDSLKEAKDYMLNKENPDLIIITGSLYLASEYRNMSTEE